MYPVTKAYTKAEKVQFRENSSILVSFGLFNEEAQHNATLDPFATTWFSRYKDVLEIHQEDDFVSYATLDENFMRVDGGGAQVFLPKPGEVGVDAPISTGLVSEAFVDEVSSIDFHLKINTYLPVDFHGLTLAFDDNFPTHFKVTLTHGDGSTTVKDYTDNKDRIVKTQDAYENVREVHVSVLEMNNKHTRLRLHYIMFGHALVYGDNDVINASWSQYVSPIAEDIPQVDFSVTVSNLDRYFNVDNPNSAIHFFDAGQSGDVYFGQYIAEEDRTEWVKNGHLFCQSWSADETKATLTLADGLRLREDDFTRCLDATSQHLIIFSYRAYDYAKKILDDMGEVEYHLDPYLKKVYINPVLDAVPHKQALQMIANAARCYLFVDRDGVVRIESRFIPNKTVTIYNAEPYCNADQLLTDTLKKDYAQLNPEAVAVDGGNTFSKPGYTPASNEVGFVSKEVSDENGFFNVVPAIVIKQDAEHTVYGLDFEFGYAVPKHMAIATSLEGKVQEIWICPDKLTKNIKVRRVFQDFDTMEISFPDTEYPHNRLVLKHLQYDGIPAFDMEKQDITSSITATQRERISDIKVTYKTYFLQNEPSDLYSEENFTPQLHKTYTFDISKAADPRATLEFTPTGASEPTKYYISDLPGENINPRKVSFTFHELPQDGTGDIAIKGYAIDEVEHTYVKHINDTGVDIEWSNPLIRTEEQARQVADWITSYYAAPIEYSYSTRGFPEIDATDIIEQYNDFAENMQVIPYNNSISFNGAISGKIKALRTNGEFGYE